MQKENKQTIDFLVPLSGKGGVETVINRIAGYLKLCGYRVRVVQMVFDGPIWLDEDIEFYPLRREKVDDIAGRGYNHQPFVTFVIPFFHKRRKSHYCSDSKIRQKH